MGTYKDKSPDAKRGPSVELYRSVNGRDYSYRVTAVAPDESLEALRGAKAAALEIEDELHVELEERLMARKSRNKGAVGLVLPVEHIERIADLATEQDVSPGEVLRRLVAARLGNEIATEAEGSTERGRENDRR